MTLYRSLWFCIGAAMMACAPDAQATVADEMLRDALVEGGLVVHIGCGDGSLTTDLRAGDGYLVQGLDTDPAAIVATRERAQAEGLAESVTADLFDGKQLPYIDNLVNLAVVQEQGDLAMAEILRVLRPGGVALVNNNGQWTKAMKPWPAQIDEWTHYLYDATGGAVSKDRLAGHPRGLQWDGGPFWARSHEHTAGMNAMVSANGRVFYVMDEGPTESIQLPAENYLTARDAFNGVVLWKRPLTAWWNALYPLKSGPGWLPRRLVAVDDRVYIAPGVGQNVLCLDAATGDVIHEYEGTAGTFELLVDDGLLFAVVDPDMVECDYNQQNADCWKERDRASNLFAWNQDAGDRALTAVDVETGKTLWKTDMPIAPMTLVVDEKKACFYDGDAVVAIDRKTGDQLWSADVLDIQRLPTGVSGPRMILYGDYVVLSPMGSITALNGTTGELLWTVKNKPRSGHFSLEDFYIIDGVIWVLGRSNAGAYVTYDLETGEKLADYANPIKSFYIHQRCHPGRATEVLQLPPTMGIPTYNMEEDTWTNNHWVRGGCVYGLMPANGMVYVPPHACACYYQSKLNGFNALSPTPQSGEAIPTEQRLLKGPAAYLAAKDAPSNPSSEWPTFRHDATRSGYVKTDVPAELDTAWEIDCGTKLTQPVVAYGKVIFSEIETHTVRALDAESGEQAWRFIAGGRVNSPPTMYRGLALFGCADGYVYALDANTGQLAWKFLAAPSRRKLISYGQLESVWPLAGSVLVQDGKLYCVAGRSMFLDGGLRMLVLNPVTGELISENVMDRNVPGTDEQLDDLLMGKHLPVAMPDILSGDGKYVYMKSQTFTPDGKRVRIVPQRPDTQYGEEVHLFAPTSFLDDSWHQRTYWLYGRAAGEGWAEFQLPPKRVPYGRILCIDEENAYSYGRDVELLCNTSVSEYRLFSAAKHPAREVGGGRLEGGWTPSERPNDGSLAAGSVNWHALSALPFEKLSALDYGWINEEPSILARAMVLANDRLFIAGPRDVVDEKRMWGLSNDETFQAKMAEQADWFAGEHGGVLQVFEKQTGEQLAEYELPSLPAFDGLVAANGSLYMVTEDGKLCCLRGK